jgi:hypothetical protein
MPASGRIGYVRKLSDEELSYKLGATAVKIVLNWKPSVIMLADPMLAQHNRLVEEMREIVAAFLPKKEEEN